jgi:hypothetical protein
MAIPVFAQTQQIQNNNHSTSGTVQAGNLGTAGASSSSCGAGGAVAGGAIPRTVDINDVQNEYWSPIPKLPALQEFKNYQDICVKVVLFF